MKTIIVSFLLIMIIGIFNGCGNLEVSNDDVGAKYESDDIVENTIINEEENINYSDTIPDDMDADIWAERIYSDLISYNNQVDIAMEYMETDPNFAYETYHKGTDFLLDIADVLHKYPAFYDVVLIDDVDGFYRMVQRADICFKELMEGGEGVDETEYDDLKINVTTAFNDIQEKFNEMISNLEKMSANAEKQEITLLNAKQCMERITSYISLYLSISEKCYDYMEDNSSADGSLLYENLQIDIGFLLATEDWLKDFQIIYQVDDFCQSAQDVENAFKNYVDGVGSGIEQSELIEFVKSFRRADYNLNSYFTRISNQVERINKEIADGKYSTYSYAEGVKGSGTFGEQKEPAIGMTKTDIEQSTWGKPEKINKTTYSWGTTEQWCYSDYKYIYFENGIVTAISE